MKALLIVDVQNDFCEGGALAAPHSNEIIPVINDLMDQFELVVASKDWHPEKTVHFDKWPVHCVQNSSGAEFHPQLNADRIDTVVLKGTSDKDDGYSAFEATSHDLAAYLRDHKVRDLYVCGLATDYCVKSTALDANRLGFNVSVIKNAIMGVNVNPGDAEKAIEEMKSHGVGFITSQVVPTY